MKNKITAAEIVCMVIGAIIWIFTILGFVLDYTQPLD
jgi:hypothetical protein